MDAVRAQGLRKNVSYTFWIQACMNARLFGAISSLFYLHRGLSLSEILYLGIIWAIANTLTEVPSSYLADRWGRKKTIMLGVILGLLYWVFYFFADSFIIFAIGAALYGINVAMMSGTDEALLYDSAKELGEDGSHGLKHLSHYYSAKRFFKIITPIIAVLLAKDLLEWQFQLIIVLDICFTLIAAIFSLRLTEPQHTHDIEEQNAGILHDAVILIKKDHEILYAIINRLLPFIASLMVWQYSQVYYSSLGISLLAIGIGWSLMQLGSYIISRYILPRISLPLEKTINRMTAMTTLMTVFFLLFAWLLPNPYILYSCFIFFAMLENTRNPLYSTYLNKKMKSFNRATSLSLTNICKSILEVPIMLIAALLITKSMLYPYMLASLLCIITIVFFRMPKGAQIASPNT